MKKLMAMILAGFLVSCSSTSTTYEKFCGVWNLEVLPEYRNIGTFSWGNNPYAKGSVYIDLYDRKPYVSTEGGRLYAKSFNVDNNTLYIEGAFFDETKTKGKLVIHMLDNNTIWIEDNTGNGKWSIHSGMDSKYYRVPKDAAYKPWNNTDSP